MIKKIALLLLVVLVVIQFFHPEKNISKEEAAPAGDISKVFPASDAVQGILEKSCYDCHSNHTNYPWYAEVQPFAWWINHHIQEGKEELNFNEFGSYRPRRQYRKLEEIADQVKEGEMPLGSYTLIHRDAKLSESQKKAIADGVSMAMDSMKMRYPADSLLKKK